MPAGAAALAGTSFPIDRHMVADALDFDRPTGELPRFGGGPGFRAGTLSAASICAVHLSRLAEEIVLWTTPHIAFVTLSDKFTTGSSIMPQKRNPMRPSWLRGKTGRIIGAMNALISS